MNRIKQAWLALTGRLEPECECDPPKGVLFGLDPPEGCRFRVSCHRGESWHVYVIRGDGVELAHECSLVGTEGRDDEALIVLAAKRAIAAAERKVRAASLEGYYPPKRSKGKVRNG